MKNNYLKNKKNFLKDEEKEDSIFPSFREKRKRRRMASEDSPEIDSSVFCKKYKFFNSQIKL